MPDLLSELIERQRFPGEPCWVMPGYAGWSNMNLVNSALAYFNAEHGAALAFHDEFAAVLQGARKILLLVLDGMGWYNLERAHGRRPLIRHELRGAACWPLTSMFPSTTSAVMSSLTTGVPPAQHGVIGYLMYFPEYGRVFNMLSFTTPVGARRSALLRVRTGNLSRPADDLCPPGRAKAHGRRLYQPGVCQQWALAHGLRYDAASVLCVG